MNVMSFNFYLKTKILWDHPECLMSPQNLLLWCLHLGGWCRTYCIPSLSLGIILSPLFIPVIPTLFGVDAKGTQAWDGRVGCG